MKKHAFITLKENPNSNAFIQRIERSATDSFVKFAIAARCNALPTQEMKEVMQRQPHRPCEKCGKPVNGSLQHIMNGSPAHRRWIIERHDAIVRHLAKVLRTDDHQYICTNARIAQIELEENRRLKPDIQIWSQDRSGATIIEVNCPYAQEWKGQNSLQEKYERKKQKYKRLIQEMRERGIAAKAMIVVVSSLGAIYKQTEKKIRKYIRNKREANKICRMISSLAILGSARLWWKSKERFRDIRAQEEAKNNNEEEMPTEDDDIEENERWIREQSEDEQTEDLEREDENENEEFADDEDLVDEPTEAQVETWNEDDEEPEIQREEETMEEGEEQDEQTENEEMIRRLFPDN